MNRLSRDEILHRALSMADLPQLDHHERPGGVIVPSAHSIAWLQDGIDYFHHKWPWAALVKEDTSITLAKDASSITVPADFILDVRDGVLLTKTDGSHPRVRRWDLNKHLDWKQLKATQAVGLPFRYVVMPPKIHFNVAADQAYPVRLWYYALPTLIADGAAVPTFPSDWILVEWVRLRALEWARKADPGASLAYANKTIGEFQSAGFGTEHEDGNLPLDPKTFVRRSTPDPGAGWMGEVS